MAAALGDGLSNPTVRSFGQFLMVYNGQTWDRVRVPNLWKPFAATAIGSATTLWASPGVSKRSRIMICSFTPTAAVSFQLVRADGTTVIWQGPILVANQPYNFSWSNGIAHPAVNEDMKILASGACSITGTFGGCEENVP